LQDLTNWIAGTVQQLVTRVAVIAQNVCMLAGNRPEIDRKHFDKRKAEPRLNPARNSTRKTWPDVQLWCPELEVQWLKCVTSKKTVFLITQLLHLRAS